MRHVTFAVAAAAAVLVAQAPAQAAGEWWNPCSWMGGGKNPCSAKTPSNPCNPCSPKAARQKQGASVNPQTVDPAGVSVSQLRSLSGKDFDTVASRGMSSGQMLMGGQPIGGTPRTVIGELVDLSCYTSAGLTSGNHALCARVCALKGAPVGLRLDDGTVYQVVPAQAGMPLADDVLDAVATKVRATGNVNDRGGLRTISITKVEDL